MIRLMVYGSVVLIYFYFLIWPLGLLVRLLRNRAQENTPTMLSRINTIRHSFLNSPTPVLAVSKRSPSCRTLIVHYPSCRTLEANNPSPKTLESSFETIYSRRNSLNN